LNWLSQDAPEASLQAARWRFTWGDLQGSLLFVASDSWRAQHRPERCFTVYGLEVQESLPWMVQDDFPLRWLTLGYGKEPALYSAAYWLQSSSRITEDYAARIWDDLAPQPEPWVLVTVLFDEPVDFNSDSARELMAVLRTAVQESLTSSEQDALGSAR
jgi:exosortase O